MEYALNLRHGETGAWILSFPDFPRFAVVSARSNELLERAGFYLSVALYNEYSATRTVPIPSASGTVLLEADPMLLLRFKLCEALEQRARSDPSSLEPFIFFTPEPGEDLLDLVIEYDDHSVMLTFSNLELEMAPPAATLPPTELRESITSPSVAAAASVHVLLLNAYAVAAYASLRGL